MYRGDVALWFVAGGVDGERRGFAAVEAEGVFVGGEVGVDCVGVVEWCVVGYLVGGFECFFCARGLWFGGEFVFFDGVWVGFVDCQ